MNARRVLVVEDRTPWERILEEQILQAQPDVSVEVLGSFEEAMKVLDGGWALIVVDIGLPPNDLHQLGRHLIRQASRKGLKAIAVSGLEIIDGKKVRDIIKMDGAEDYFSKGDFDDLQFQAAVRKVLGGEPPRLLPQGTKVEIGQGMNHLILRAQNDQAFPPFSLAGQAKGLFLLFALKVVWNAAPEFTEWKELNLALRCARRRHTPKPKGREQVELMTRAKGSESERGRQPGPGETGQNQKNASQELRAAICGLNRRLQEQCGLPPNGGAWVETQKGYAEEGGARLNPSIQWSVGGKLGRILRRHTQSVHSFPMDPGLIGVLLEDPDLLDNEEANVEDEERLSPEDP